MYVYLKIQHYKIINLAQFLEECINGLLNKIVNLDYERSQLLKILVLRTLSGIKISTGFYKLLSL